MKYGEVSLGEVEAAINKMGGIDVWNAYLRGNITAEFKEVIKKLFDKNGRRIPPDGMKSLVCDPDKNFYLKQPRLITVADYDNRLLRLHGYLGIDTEITANKFRQETERLLALIRDNSQIANIANGIWLPVILPKLTNDDLGQVLEQYLEAVSKSYAKTFSNRKFYNHRQGTLAGKVGIVLGSRHDQLTERMKQGHVVGIHFPNPLQGFSVNADREQMKTLQESFILSGLDAIIAMIMYLDVLARDHYTPGLDLAAFSWQSAAYSLGFWATGDGLAFDAAAGLARAHAYAYFSGGLLFLG